MTGANNSNNLKDVLEVAEIKVTANAEAYNKASIWVDKVEIDSSNILDGMMSKFESWNSSLRNELL